MSLRRNLTVQLPLDNCRIVSLRQNGYLKLKKKNLFKFIGSVVDSLPNKTPVALLSIIGPPSSGKSFLTNLLIHYFKNLGDEDWIEAVKRSNVSVGFHWDTVNPSHGLVAPTRQDAAESGIYLWPEPYRLGGRNVIVWILHIYQANTGQYEDVRKLEAFLMLACTRLAEIHFDNDKFRIMELRSALHNTLYQSSATPTVEICNSTVCISRSSSGSLDKFDNIEGIKIAHLRESNRPLHDAYGYLNLRKKMRRSLKRVIETVADEAELFPKVRDDEEIRLTDFFRYFEDCVSIINRMRQHSQQQVQHSMSNASRTTFKSYKSPQNDLEKFVEWTQQQIQEKLDEAALNWINLYATIDNIPEIEFVYEELLQENVLLCSAHIEKREHAQFESMVDSKSRNRSMKYLNDLRTSLVLFNETLRNYLNYYVCLSPSNMAEVGRIESKKVSGNISDPKTSKLFEFGVEKLMRGYMDENSKRIEAEVEFAVKMKDTIVKFYHEEMRCHLAGDVYSSEMLLTLHQTLVKDLAEAYQESLRIKNGNHICDDVQPEITKLKEALNLSSKIYLDKNKLNLGNMSSQMKGIIGKARENYNEKMDSTLKLNPNGIRAELLREKSAEVAEDIRQYVEVEIREKVRWNEPMGPHINSFLTHVKNYLPVVEEENEENLKKGMPPPQSRSATPKKIQPEEHIEIGNLQRYPVVISKRQQSSSVEEQRSPILTTTAVVEVHKPEVKKRSSSRRKQKQSEVIPPTASIRSKTPQQSHSTSTKNLPPLVFQLQPRHIKMAMVAESGVPQILNDPAGASATPFIVGLDQDGQFRYGNEVIAHMDGSANIYRSMFSERWWIPEKFANGESIFAYPISSTDGDSHFITVEFLLGLILRRLKNFVEHQLNGTFTTAVITVPFWYNSVARSQVKSGGKAAGFSNVYLVNESSAAAYHYCSGKNLPSMGENILLLTENDNKVDATVYSFYPGENKLVMAAHSGNYCLVENTNRRRTLLGSMGKGGIKKASQNKEKDDLKRMCREVIAKTQDARTNEDGLWNAPKRTVLSEEPAKWRGLFEIMGREFTPEMDHFSANSVVFGAAMLSKYPADIKNKIQDKVGFNISRVIGSGNDSRRMCEIKEKGLPFQMVLTMQRKKKSLKMSQLFGEEYVKLGELTLKSSSQPVEAQFVVNSENILKLESVSTASNNVELRQDQYTWSNYVLSGEDMGKLKTLLESLTTPGTKQKGGQQALESFRQILSSKCEEMSREYGMGGYDIKSDVVKDIFKKAVADGAKAAKDPNATMGELEQHVHKLQELSSKYSKSE